MHIGNRIRKIRMLRGFSREYVYAGIVSNSHFSNIEKGRFQPPTETLQLMAERMEVPPHYLSDFYEEDAEVATIIERLSNCMKNHQLQEAQDILNSYQEKLAYISSVWQELDLNLIRFDVYTKLHQEDEAKLLFEREIQGIIHLQDVPPELQYKYLKIYGTYSLMQKDFEQSLRHYQQALSSSYDMSDQVPIHYNLAMCYYRLGDIEKACENLDKVLHYELRMQKWVDAIHSYNLFGVLFQKKKDYQQAQRYYQYGIALSELIQLKDVLIIGKLYHNLGFAYFEQDNLEEAEKMLLHCLELRKDAPQIDKVKTIYLVIEIYIKQGYLEKACLELDRYKTIIPRSLYTFCQAKLARQQQENDEFERYILQAISCLGEEKEDIYLLEALEYYIPYLEEKRKYKQAYELLKKYHHIKK
ncbi:helix-turn-helix domain-containing protein [Bacillus ndiopicus]|uniref:helix-turn-helix domain-containing protein n=1 Tax=Bacillus ndiopicus TaxID=1347368 RepID=UPI0022819E9E|nr:tetratricopeptide repeat protein [Bacillus ndiopicus]